ncbi:hypothetical protein DOTSEDRAFT_119211 [Dothistroma septosporum NZE10]|uniref:RBR-type E3 ubiquitin transferase n=1 Tax=Dothistroma septosporum (strain NZE10 / CBS 128990) TaxID=675120 RepID=N1Q2R2_DOTSN|nr:hypothetical protein DOTSEDRAFT_119211 [Dothistroma septosporum NZE10]
MAQFPSSNGTEPKEIVECSVCNGDVGLPNIVVIDNSPVCHVCVKQIFINATEDESNYPPRWADQELKITQYKHILDEDLVKQYRRKTHEYRKKWDDRVYCPTEQEGKVCGEYLGGRRNKDKHTRLASTCKKCSKRTCLACETQPTSRSGHVCDPSTEEKEQEAASFAGLSKGKDWQKCPNCKRNIELEDGCNHVVCRCGTSLCFVCGEQN